MLGKFFGWKTTLVLVILLITASLPIYGDSWVLLGKREVNLGVDHDEIQVTASPGEYNRIKLAVRKHSVRFFDVTVIFKSGNQFNVPIRRLIPVGGESQIIKLPGRNRTIRRIILVYETPLHAKTRAEVGVWGLRD